MLEKSRNKVEWNAGKKWIYLKMTKIIVRKNFSTGEEIANSITHGFGILLGITALVLFIIKGGRNHNFIYLLSMTVYSISIIVLYTN